MNALREYLREQRRRSEASPNKLVVVGINALFSVAPIALATISALHPHRAGEQCGAVAIIVAVSVIWLKHGYDKLTS
jgi:hypothetical protein